MKYQSDKPTLHIVIRSYFPAYTGGREVWLAHILNNLLAKGQRIVLYTLEASERTVHYDLPKSDRFKHVVIPNLPRNPKRYAFMQRISFKTYGFIDILLFYRFVAAPYLEHEVQDGDFVLTMNPVIDITPAIRLRQKNNRQFTLICGAHGLVAIELSRAIPFLRPWFTYLEKRSLKAADVILANGLDTQAYLKSIGFDSQVVPNGANIREFMQPSHLDDPALEPMRKLRENGVFVIGILGSLRPIKGTFDVIESIPHLKGITDKQFKVVFVGKGDQIPYQQRAAKLGAADEVAFVGEQTNVSGFVHHFNLAVCVSGGGGTSIAARECMAAGKAIIAWDNLVYQQMICSGKTGLLVPEKDVNALAQGIFYAMSNPAEAHTWGQAAQTESQQFDWAAVADKFSKTVGLI